MLTIPKSWQTHLNQETEKPYYQNLKTFITGEYQDQTIYPAQEDIFKAFDLCPFEQIKVIILGQDPYHGPNQAMGLSFSVPQEIKLPPSLKNIYKEITSDCNITPEPHGDLTRWANQGVFLLNSILTVRVGEAASHHKQGWEEFTSQVIQTLSEKKEKLVFILWGSYAQKKGNIIDENKHLVLKSVHPSPLSSYRGFFGCKHFSQANGYLENHQIQPIDWS